MSYEKIGDLVNLGFASGFRIWASHLEGLEKVYATEIMVSEDARRPAPAVGETRERDVVTVAGMSEPTSVHEMLGRAGEVDASRVALRDRCVEGVGCYRALDFDGPDRAVGDCLQIDEEVGPSLLMLRPEQSVCDRAGR